MNKKTIISSWKWKMMKWVENEKWNWIKILNKLFYLIKSYLNEYIHIYTYTRKIYKVLFYLFHHPNLIMSYNATITKWWGINFFLRNKKFSQIHNSRPRSLSISHSLSRCHPTTCLIKPRPQPRPHLSLSQPLSRPLSISHQPLSFPQSLSQSLTESRPVSSSLHSVTPCPIKHPLYTFLLCTWSKKPTQSLPFSPHLPHPSHSQISSLAQAQVTSLLLSGM